MLLPVLVCAAVAVLQLLFVSVFLLGVLLVFAGKQKPKGAEIRCKRSDVVQMHRHRKKDVIDGAAATSDTNWNVYSHKHWRSRGQLPAGRAKVMTPLIYRSPQTFHPDNRRNQSSGHSVSDYKCTTDVIQKKLISGSLCDVCLLI